MSILYMMVGIAGSGKSYAASVLAKDSNTHIVSSDVIRAELYGSEDDQSHNAEVFEEVHRRVRSLLNEGANVVYDATNLSRKRRVGFLKQLPSDIYKVAILVATDIKIILQQNMMRERQVPEDVIMSMYKRMQLPRMDEGWDEILVRRNERNEPLFNSVHRCFGFDQDNPHHTLTLFDHMREASDLVDTYMRENDCGFSAKEKRTVSIAAFCHDVGKPDTKTYQLWSGKIDDHAHYYNHAEVGAYIFLCGCNSEDIDIKTAASLIQWHMEYFAMSPEKLREKVSLYYGGKFAKMLYILHRGDVDAH